MFTRRQVVVAGACGLAAPYFYSTTIIKADELTDGLVDNVRVLADNLSMTPAGRVDGNDREVAGGGTVYGRTQTAQTDEMASEGSFVVTVEDDVATRELCSDGIGYMFARFTESRRNCCLPLGYVANQNEKLYGGAMTLLEGPNLVGLRVLTAILKNKGYNSTQISDLCWPVRPSITSNRERALVLFQSEIRKVTYNGTRVYADRDVLHANAAECVLRYTHKNGIPDGGGQGALIVSGQEQFRFDFQFNKDVF